MKKLLLNIIFIGVFLPLYDSDTKLESCISSYDYDTRKEMKIECKALIELLKFGKAQLVYIRLKEEYLAWRVSEFINIPINELPSRLAEIDKSKIIVTACPHKERTIIAMT